eukprot:5738901-Amphidinium_carterae.2
MDDVTNSLDSMLCECGCACGPQLVPSAAEGRHPFLGMAYLMAGRIIGRVAILLFSLFQAAHEHVLKCCLPQSKESSQTNARHCR